MSAVIVSEAIVVVNAGSTSLKFAAYAVDASWSLALLCRGRNSAVWRAILSSSSRTWPASNWACTNGAKAARSITK